MTSTRAIVSAKGQVVIPKVLRDRLGIRPGQRLEFSDERGKLVARKATAQDPVDRVYGVLELKGGVDETLRELRGEADAAHGDRWRFPHAQSPGGGQAPALPVQLDKDDAPYRSGRRSRRHGQGRTVTK